MIIKGIQLQNETDFSEFLDTHKKTQIFDVSLFVSERHIRHCVEQALKAFAQKRNISRSPELEFLLCLTSERQVKNALKKAKAGKKAVFVSWVYSNSAWVDFQKKFEFTEIRLKEKPDMEAIQKSATFWVLQ